ncbi:hypothetical protein AAG570_011702 [Ranatra chinensis]|uniref:Uncharacterized protein n=1 Tax=Ranatra chinensis TaxID=642074 RepID=A0ABD0Z4Z5_9HEMI
MASKRRNMFHKNKNRKQYTNYAFNSINYYVESTPNDPIIGTVVHLRQSAGGYRTEFGGRDLIGRLNTKSARTQSDLKGKMRQEAGHVENIRCALSQNGGGFSSGPFRDVLPLREVSIEVGQRFCTVCIIRINGDFRPGGGYFICKPSRPCWKTVRGRVEYSLWDWGLSSPLSLSDMSDGCERSCRAYARPAEFRLSFLTRGSPPHLAASSSWTADRPSESQTSVSLRMARQSFRDRLAERSDAGSGPHSPSSDRFDTYEEWSTGLIKTTYAQRNRRSNFDDVQAAEMAAKSKRQLAQNKPPVPVRNNFRELAVWCYHYNFDNITPITVPPLHSQLSYMKFVTSNGNKKCLVGYCGFKLIYRPPIQIFKSPSQQLACEKNKKEETSTSRKITPLAKQIAPGCRLFSHQASILESLQLYRELYIYPRNTTTKSEQRLLDQTISEVVDHRRQQQPQSNNSNRRQQQPHTARKHNLSLNKQSLPVNLKLYHYISDVRSARVFCEVVFSAKFLKIVSNFFHHRLCPFSCTEDFSEAISAINSMQQQVFASPHPLTLLIPLFCVVCVSQQTKPKGAPALRCNGHKKGQEEKMVTGSQLQPNIACPQRRLLSRHCVLRKKPPPKQLLPITVEKPYFGVDDQMNKTSEPNIRMKSPETKPQLKHEESKKRADNHLLLTFQSQHQIFKETCEEKPAIAGTPKLLHHVRRVVRCDWRFSEARVGSLLVERMAVSSAKEARSVAGCSGMSEVYTEYSRGLRMLPCGTPPFIGK